MMSRLMQLLVLDVLVTGVAQKNEVRIFSRTSLR